MSVILCVDSKNSKNQYSMPEQLSGFYIMQIIQLMYNSKAQRSSFFNQLMEKVQPFTKTITVIESLTAQKQMQCKTLLWVFNDLELRADSKLSCIDSTGEKHPVDGKWHPIRREPTTERYRVMHFYPETGTFNIPEFTGASMFDSAITAGFARRLHEQFIKYNEEK